MNIKHTSVIPTKAGTTTSPLPKGEGQGWVVAESPVVASTHPRPLPFREGRAWEFAA